MCAWRHPPESNRGKHTGTHDSTPLNASELLTRLINKCKSDGCKW